MSTYKILIGEERRTIEIDENGHTSIDGIVLKVEAWANERGLLTVRAAEKAHKILVDHKENLCYELWINHRCYRVQVEDSRSGYLSRIEGQAGTHIHHGKIAAPMPGMIARIEVAVGSIVECGTGLLVLEAMKMENEIKAPIAGIVKAIHVQPHAGVEKGELLVTIEPHSEKRD